MILSISLYPQSPCPQTLSLSFFLFSTISAGNLSTPGLHHHLMPVDLLRQPGPENCSCPCRVAFQMGLQSLCHSAHQEMTSRFPPWCLHRLVTAPRIENNEFWKLGHQRKAWTSTWFPWDAPSQSLPFMLHESQATCLCSDGKNFNSSSQPFPDPRHTSEEAS